MSFRWVYPAPGDGAAVDELQRALFAENGSARQQRISPAGAHTIARLLALRGVTTFDSARLFFRPDLSALHDPFLMKDMEAAACRLATAVRNSERVVVYGDYDVDGTTATAIIYTFLKQFGVSVSHYIPHRFKEGYGINEDGLQYAEDVKATLIVSVDCGITAVEEAKIAKSKGIDLVICDHHTAGDEIPDAVAVLDPKRPDCSYPFDGLSGAGVAFKLVQATITKFGLDQKEAYKYLDLVAISIASDIVPIIDENRILMREGLKLVNQSPRPGIRSLMNLIKMDIGKVSTSNIVFSIGPRINAAGRMGDATTALQLLMSETSEEGDMYARELEQINQRRRKTDMMTMTRAVELVDQMDMAVCPCMVLHDPEWHLGVIGIVASRLVDQYCRPAVMLSTVDGKIKGSARSIRGFNIYDALKECDDLLIQFGGHEYAAGLTMDEDKLPEFRLRFNQIVDRKLQDEDFAPELRIDAEINLKDIDQPFWKILSQFEPYGPHNSKPIFVSKDLRVLGSPMKVGRDHLKLRVAQNGGVGFEAIGFNLGKYYDAVSRCYDGGLDLAFTIDENTWRDKTELQIQILDVKIDSKSILIEATIPDENSGSQTVT
jgi:single-stranded-DNA-specific exonuclease